MGLTAPALKLLQIACLSSDPENNKGCSKAAQILWAGKGVARDAQSAAALAKRACDAGQPAGCLVLGYAHAKGDGAPKDRKFAARLLAQACGGGDDGACLALAEVAIEGTGDEITTGELETLVPACRRGLLTVCIPGADAASRLNAPEVAMAMYQRGCEADLPGSVRACDLGGRLFIEKGGDAAETGALLSRKACAARVSDACVRAAVAESFLPSANVARI